MFVLLSQDVENVNGTSSGNGQQTDHPTNPNSGNSTKPTNSTSSSKTHTGYKIIIYPTSLVDKVKEGDTAKMSLLVQVNDTNNTNPKINAYVSDLASQNGTVIPFSVATLSPQPLVLNKTGFGRLIYDVKIPAHQKSDTYNGNLYLVANDTNSSNKSVSIHITVFRDTNYLVYFVILVAGTALSGLWTGSNDSKQSKTATSQQQAVTLSVPSVPTGLIATAGDKQVLLSWAAPTDDGGSAITGYNIYRGAKSGMENSEPIAKGITSTTYTDKGLTDGQVYYYTVKAVNSVGESCASMEASATKSALPSPSGLIATAGDKQVLLSWAAPTDDGGSAITGYNIYRGAKSGMENSEPIAKGITSTTYTDKGLTDGQVYYYTVKAACQTSVDPSASNKSSEPTESLASNEASATPSGTSKKAAIIKASFTTITAVATVSIIFNQFLETYPSIVDLPMWGWYVPFGIGFLTHHALDNLIDQSNFTLKPSVSSGT